MGDKLSVPKLYGEYIEALLKHGQHNFLPSLISMIYSENKIYGSSNIFLWDPIIRLLDRLDVLDKLREAISDITDSIDQLSRKYIMSAISLARVKNMGINKKDRHEIKTILSSGHIYFLMELISILASKQQWGYILDTLKNITNEIFDIKTVGEVLFAALMRAINADRRHTIMEILEIAKDKISSIQEIYANFLFESALRILDIDKKLAGELMKEALPIYADSGFRWMTLNVLGVLCAHNLL